MAYNELYKAVVENDANKVEQLLECEEVDSRCVFIKVTSSPLATWRDQQSEDAVDSDLECSLSESVVPPKNEDSTTSGIVPDEEARLAAHCEDSVHGKDIVKTITQNQAPISVSDTYVDYKSNKAVLSMHAEASSDGTGCEDLQGASSTDTECAVLTHIWGTPSIAEDGIDNTSTPPPQDSPPGSPIHTNVLSPTIKVFPAEDLEHQDTGGEQDEAASSTGDMLAMQPQKTYRFRLKKTDHPGRMSPHFNPIEFFNIEDIQFQSIDVNGSEQLSNWKTVEVSLVDATHFLRTPLTLAVLCHSDAVLRLLLSRDDCASVEMLDGWAQSAIHLSVWHGKADLLEMLLEKDCDVNVVFSDGNSPLHLAAKYGRTQCAQVLLAAGAQVNCTNFQSESPTHIAAQHNHADILSLFLQAGSNVNTTDCQGLTALHVTESADCAQILLDAGIEPDHLLPITTVKDSDPKKTRVLLDILTHMVKENRTAIVRVLLKAGFPTNQSYRVGQDTPLHWAICNASVECVQLLLNAGANVNAVNSCGNTPLMVASTRYNMIKKKKVPTATLR